MPATRRKPFSNEEKRAEGELWRAIRSLLLSSSSTHEKILRRILSHAKANPGFHVAVRKPGSGRTTKSPRPHYSDQTILENIIFIYHLFL